MTPTPIGGALLKLGFQMSETNPKTKTNKIAERSYFINTTDMQAYLDGTSAAERDSTNVGAFITSIQTLTLGTLKNISVGMLFDTAIAPPASSVGAYDFDQFLISSRDTVTTDPVKTSIPARKMSAVTLESDGVTCANTGLMATFRTDYEEMVLSGDDNTVSVLRTTVSS